MLVRSFSVPNFSASSIFDRLTAVAALLALRTVSLAGTLCIIEALFELILIDSKLRSALRESLESYLISGFKRTQRRNQVSLLYRARAFLNLSGNKRVREPQLYTEQELY
jgi:hypothetical protein